MYVLAAESSERPTAFDLSVFRFSVCINTQSLFHKGSTHGCTAHCHHIHVDSRAFLPDEKFARPLIKWLRALNPKALGESSASLFQTILVAHTIQNDLSHVSTFRRFQIYVTICMYVCAPEKRWCCRDAPVSYSMDTDPALLPSSARGPITIESSSRCAHYDCFYST